MSLLGHTLGMVLRSRNTSQSELARSTGLTQSTISRILSGESGADVETIGRLIDALPDPADQAELLRAYLLECAPETVRSRLTILLDQAVHEGPPRSLPIDDALATLRTAALDDPDLHSTLTFLADVVRRPGHRDDRPKQ